MTDVRIARDDLGFVEVWHCDQPDTYVVLRQDWTEDYAERHIYEVRAVEWPQVMSSACEFPHSLNVKCPDCLDRELCYVRDDRPFRGGWTWFRRVFG